MTTDWTLNMFAQRAMLAFHRRFKKHVGPDYIEREVWFQLSAPDLSLTMDEIEARFIGPVMESMALSIEKEFPNRRFNMVAIEPALLFDLESSCQTYDDMALAVIRNGSDYVIKVKLELR